MDERELPPEYLLTQNYRDFLLQLVGDAQRRHKLTYGSLAKRCGFRARSFLRDVAVGEKHLTETSFRKLLDGLPLHRDEIRLFELLVQLDEPELRSSRTSEKRLHALVAKARERCQQRYQTAGSAASTTSQALRTLMARPEFAALFCALGEPEVGAKLEDVVRRTKISKKRCVEILEEMASLGVVTFDGATGRYRAASAHAIIDRAGREEAGRAFLLGQMDAARSRLLERAEAPTDLFHASTFSLSLTRATQLREALRKTILDFVDEYEEADGDAIAVLTLSAFVR